MNHSHNYDSSNEYKNTVRPHNLFADKISSNGIINNTNNGENIFDNETKEFQNALEKLYCNKSEEKFINELIYSKLDKCNFNIEF